MQPSRPRTARFFVEHCLKHRVMWVLIQIRFILLTGWLESKDYFRNGKPSVVRAILGVSSFVWASTCLWPQGTFERPAYAHLVNFLGLTEYLPVLEAKPRVAELIWATMFYSHFIGLSLIAIYKPKEDTWPLIVNTYGLTLWMTTTLAINWAVHAVSPGSSMEITVCTFATWALYRTEFSDSRN